MIDDTDTPPPGDDDQDAPDPGAPADASDHADHADAAAADDGEPPMEQQIEEAHPSVASIIPDDYDPNQSPLVDPVVIPVEPGRKRPPWYGRTGAKRRFEFALKAQKALEYRKLGYDYTQIAQFLGYANRQGAHYAVQQALKARTAELADEVLSLDLARLDALYLGVSAPAVQGDLMAVSTALTIIDRRQKMLGLEKPTKIAPTDKEGNDLPLPAAVAWTGTLGVATGLVAQLLAAGVKNVVPDEPDVPEEKPA